MMDFHQRLPKSSAYERLKTVGKGAFGTAILYRRKWDNMTVIIKEINMLDLNTTERQMALNEVKVLSTLHHPNIVTYFDSFEEEGILMIEMEYADGGTLHERLSHLDRPMDEKTVLMLFAQIANAVEYMHGKRVLHRDLKTANIFLTRVNQVKIGDFGISKMSESRYGGGANTVVGTPYYISPEMCEGKGYDDKSDIWALGCILYEMVCLHKTFEGNNLPTLVHKIMKGQFTPIRGNYSHEFRQLVRDMLQREPIFRPAASEIVRNKLPLLLKQSESEKMTVSQSPSMDNKKAKRLTRSVLYVVKFVEETLDLAAVPLPSRQWVMELSVSETHCIALTSDSRVYSWGNNSHQQLGLDQCPSRVDKPTLVRALKGTTVSKVSAGHGFSVFSRDNGLLMTVGDGSRGCLGHGDWSDLSKPKIVEKLLGVSVTAMSCGPYHVVVVADQRFVFSWGCGADGRLGLGTEDSMCSPTEILFPESVLIPDVRCGPDDTLFLTSNGKVWVCGSNGDNKLGLNSKGRFWKGHREVVHQLLPVQVRGIARAVVDASLGPGHTALLLDNGQVMTSGSNGGGQLGHDNQHLGFRVVTAIEGKNVRHVECGDTFTLVGTEDNALYAWGRRPVHQGHFGSKSPSAHLTLDLQLQPPVDSNRPTRELGPRKGHVTTASMSSPEPREMLVLYASPEQVTSGETVTLDSVICQTGSAHLLVSTTAPVPHRDDQCPNLEHERNARENTLDDDTPPADGGEDGTTLIPDWLRKEFQESEDWWRRHADAGAP